MIKKIIALALFVGAAFAGITVSTNLGSAAALPVITGPEDCPAGYLTLSKPVKPQVGSGKELEQIRKKLRKRRSIATLRQIKLNKMTNITAQQRAAEQARIDAYKAATAVMFEDWVGRMRLHWWWYVADPEDG